MIPTEHAVALSAILFVIGLAGAVLRRDLLSVLISIELMLGASGLALVAFDRVWVTGADGGARVDGQVSALLIASIGVAGLAVGLGVLVALVRNRDSIDSDDVSELRW